MPELVTIDHENLSNTVYATLCDALITGKFQPGERLRIREMADQLGTSVTPVRDAILRLTHDEALVFRSPRDIRIPVISEQRFVEIRAIRLKLETLGAETAAQLATTEDIEALHTLMNAADEAFAAQDKRKAAELHQAFHFKVIAIANMPVLQGILRRIWLQMGPVLMAVSFDTARSFSRRHHPVVDALRQHDSAAAANAIRDDIMFGGKVVLSHIQSR